MERETRLERVGGEAEATKALGDQDTIGMPAHGQKDVEMHE